MRIYDFEQRSPEWYQIRRGVITGSNANNILVDSYRPSYVYQLIAEITTGESYSFPDNEAMQWGRDNEAEACEMYEKVTGNVVQHVGFCKPDDRDGIGCSPDGLIGEEGYLEIKCPFKSSIYIQQKLKGAKLEYTRQIQFGLLVTGRKWADFVIYDPRQKLDSMKITITRTGRDEVMISEMRKRISMMQKQISSFLEANGMEYKW